MNDPQTTRSAKEDFRMLIATIIDESRLTRNEIACVLGYENPNMISMFKTGKPKQKSVG